MSATNTRPETTPWEALARESARQMRVAAACGDAELVAIFQKATVVLIDRHLAARRNAT